MYFLLQRADLHRHLHCFPTRRSSDLFPPATDKAFVDMGLRVIRAPLFTGPALLMHWEKAGPVNSGARMTRKRSEEHTSELQSLRHLVCRLLLEKKKNTKQTL